MSEHQLWNELGNIYNNSGEHKQAIGAYEKAIELNPKSGWAHSNLALAYIRASEPEQAIAHYQRSIELFEDFAEKAEAWHKLGAAYQMMDDVENTLLAFQRAAELNPANEAYQVDLDMAMAEVPVAEDDVEDEALVEEVETEEIVPEAEADAEVESEAEAQSSGKEKGALMSWLENTIATLDKQVNQPEADRDEDESADDVHIPSIPSEIAKDLIPILDEADVDLDAGVEELMGELSEKLALELEEELEEPVALEADEEGEPEAEEPVAEPDAAEEAGEMQAVEDIEVVAEADVEAEAKAEDESNEDVEMAEEEAEIEFVEDDVEEEVSLAKAEPKWLAEIEEDDDDDEYEDEPELALDDADEDIDDDEEDEVDEDEDFDVELDDAELEEEELLVKEHALKAEEAEAAEQSAGNGNGYAAAMRNASVWGEMGNIFFNADIFDGALIAYQKALELDESYGAVMHNLGLLHMHKGEFEKAVELYQKSIALLDDNAAAQVISWNNLGNAYRAMRNYEEAQEAYRKADELDTEKIALESWTRQGLLSTQAA